MPKEYERKVDVLAGEGSQAARLKARRMAIEAGDVENAQNAYNAGSYPIEDSTKRRREGTGRFPVEEK